jgi:hypothetical protein
MMSLKIGSKKAEGSAPKTNLGGNFQKGTVSLHVNLKGLSHKILKKF